MSVMVSVQEAEKASNVEICTSSYVVQSPDGTIALGEKEKTPEEIEVENIQKKFCISQIDHIVDHIVATTPTAPPRMVEYKYHKQRINLLLVTEMIAFGIQLLITFFVQNGHKGNIDIADMPLLAIAQVSIYVISCVIGFLGCWLNSKNLFSGFLLLSGVIILFMINVPLFFSWIVILIRMGILPMVSHMKKILAMAAVVHPTS